MTTSCNPLTLIVVKENSMSIHRGYRPEVGDGHVGGSKVWDVDWMVANGRTQPQYVHSKT